ncbi:hypothetical protein Lal_00039608 [Lupinus albus]|nr:hypothetical protein Lal_00039608 [Lupinus albus]
MFLSNGMLLDQMTKTLLRKRWLKNLGTQQWVKPLATAVGAKRRESESLWGRFCNWITSTENRLYIGWFGVLMIAERWLSVQGRKVPLLFQGKKG